MQWISVRDFEIGVIVDKFIIINRLTNYLWYIPHQEERQELKPVDDHDQSADHFIRQLSKMKFLVSLVKLYVKRFLYYYHRYIWYIYDDYWLEIICLSKGGAKLCKIGVLLRSVNFVVFHCMYKSAKTIWLRCLI